MVVPLLIIIPAVIVVSTVVVVVTDLIAETVTLIIDRAKEAAKAAAPGMPKPPRCYSKKNMMKDAEKLGLKYECYNFAFCGPQGAGKSALINGLRCLPDGTKTSEWKHNSLDSAPTGEKETTSEINEYRYPDAHPFRNVRYWDIPGCGTVNYQIKNYFMKEKLFVFDCLLICTAGNLGEYELKLIEDAGICERPVIIVLTKTELKAEAKAEKQYDHKNLSLEQFKPIVQETIEEAKKHMWDVLNKAKAKNKLINIANVFVISANKFRKFYRTNNDDDALLSFETAHMLEYIINEAKNKRVA